jgi:Amt family ammonium transporter
MNLRSLLITLMLAGAALAGVVQAEELVQSPATSIEVAQVDEPAATPAPRPRPAAAPRVDVKQVATDVATEVATKVATDVSVATVAAAEAAKAAAAAEEAAKAEATPAAPTFNEGNVTWMMTATAFVLLMSLPGLALFYGGMTRSKNMLSTMTQIFAIYCLIAVLWVVYGYSVAFSGTGPFFGTLDKMFLNGVVTADGFTSFVATATFSKGVVIPELMFAIFQMTFACITVGLIAGGYAERMKFKAVLIFSVVWFTLAYLPMAHMVWWWAGPDAYTTAEGVADLNATAGYLWQMGALDFAGGTVVHINSGIAGLVAAIIVGKRVGYGKVAMPPHSLVMSMIGASLLWFGWFGFNAGSNLEANGYAVLAFANTMIATATAALAWFFAEWLFKGKPSLLGIISGAIAGLVGITPACGFVGVQGALVIGLVAGAVCFVACAYLKKLLGYDDALDVFGVHAVGGIIGAILTGVYVNPELGGVGVYADWFSMTVGYSSAQILIQVKAVLVAIVWSGTVATVTLLALKYTIGLRPSEDAEREGLDIAEHGEQAYNS